MGRWSERRLREIEYDLQSAAGAWLGKFWRVPFRDLVVVPYDATLIALSITWVRYLPRALRRPFCDGLHAGFELNIYH